MKFRNNIPNPNTGALPATPLLPTDKETIEEWTKTIQQDPNNAKAYYDRGCALCVDDHDRAMSDYTEAIRLNPNYAEAYYDRGLLQYFNKNYYEALADFESALQLDPDNAEAKEKLGKISGRVKQWLPCLYYFLYLNRS